MKREARASQQKHFARLANTAGLEYWLPLSPQPGFAGRERFEPGLGAALIQPLRVLDRIRPELSAGGGALGAVQLGTPVVHPHPVLQVSQVGRGSLPVGGRAAQRLQKCPLQDGILVGVLGKQPRRLGAVLAHQGLEPVARGAGAPAAGS